MATLLAHQFRARPLAVRVLKARSGDSATDLRGEKRLLALAEAEARNMGYELATEIVQAGNVASGILSVAQAHKTFGIVLGHPSGGTAQEFKLVVDAIAESAPCPVSVVRFQGILHTERILVPAVRFNELREVRDVIFALAGVGKHRVTVLYLRPSNVSRVELMGAEEKLNDWSKKQRFGKPIVCKTVPTEARLETIIQEVAKHDLLVMAADQPRGLHRLFFGSLAEEVAQHGQKSIIMVQAPED
jgi:nucleotide-binding universal stress UspA family protein